VQFPTGGIVRDLLLASDKMWKAADMVQFHNRQYSLDERRTVFFERYFCVLKIFGRDVSTPEYIMYSGVFMHTGVQRKNVSRSDGRPARRVGKGFPGQNAQSRIKKKYESSLFQEEFPSSKSITKKLKRKGD